MVKLDLQDAYLTVPLYREHQKFLCFTWKGQIYQFQTLPFGLSPAPLIFTKLMRPVISLLRHQGIRVLVYLDDILLMAENSQLLQEQSDLTMTLLQSLGFVLNKKKCCLVPCREIQFLGFIVNSIQMTLQLPPDKVHKIQKECRHMLNKTSVSPRQLAHLIGLLTSTLPAVLPAPLHYRALQRNRATALSPSGLNLDYDILVPLSPDAKADLNWWLQNLASNNGRLISFQKPSLTLETDASKTGWGAYCRERSL